MEIIIKNKKDILKILDQLKKEKEIISYTTEKYYKNNCGSICFYYCKNDKIIYNYRGSGGSQYLNDVELTQEEFIKALWNDRKYWNHPIIKTKKERVRGY